MTVSMDMRREVRRRLDNGETSAEISSDTGLSTFTVNWIRRIDRYKLEADTLPDRKGGHGLYYRRNALPVIQNDTSVRCEKLHTSLRTSACVKRWYRINKQGYDAYLACLRCTVGQKRFEEASQ